MLTPNEWLGFECTNDIQYFYNTGYGNNVSGAIGFPWVNATVDEIMGSQNNMSNATTDQDLSSRLPIANSLLLCSSHWVYSTTRRVPGGPTLDWYKLQGLIENLDSDVLALIDCCHAGVSFDLDKEPRGGITELIAASGINDKSWLKGPWSMTEALVTCLKSFNDGGLPFSSIDLHKSLMVYMKKVLPDRSHFKRYSVGSLPGTPVYLRFTGDGLKLNANLDSIKILDLILSEDKGSS